MAAITINDLNNAKLDVEHIAEIATSPEATATDRLGNVKDTVKGAVDTIKSINSRGAWAAATAYAVKDLVSESGTWYLCLVGHTSSPAFATDTLSRWRVYQGVIASELAASSGASLVGYNEGGANAVNRTTEEKLQETASLHDKGGVGDGATSNVTAFNNAMTDLGATGHLHLTRGTYYIDDDLTISLGSIEFDRGAKIKVAQGKHVIIDAEIIAGDYPIFDVGYTVTACDCNAASTTLRSWWDHFRASDAGKGITFLYGGALTGSAPGGSNVVQERLRFSTTISGFTSARQVTVATGPTTAIRQDYVMALTYANVNTGVVVIDGGTVEFSTNVREARAKWFHDNGSFNGRALQKAYFAFTRRYGGGAIIHPLGECETDVNVICDTGNVALLGTARRFVLKRSNSIGLEKMNNLSTVWRGRYGGGGESRTDGSETWTFGDPAAKWGGDWAIMDRFEVEGMTINGNKANQPVLTPGTLLDSWDAGLSCLYTKYAKINHNSFVNCLRWGAAISTQSHGSEFVGNYAESCDEGALYTETSDDVKFTGNTCVSSPAAGWNMGAITNLSGDRCVITGNSINGGDNGIYNRNDTVGVVIEGNSINAPTRYGVWLNDETSGSNRQTGTVVNGNSIKGGQKGIYGSYFDGAAIIGNAIDGATVAAIHALQATKSTIASNACMNSSAEDILIDSGTSYLTVIDNAGNCELTGTSSTYITFRIPSGYTYTNSGSGSGYIAVMEHNNFGDGNARLKFNGGITLGSSGFNTYPLDLNGTVIWRDSTGDLRVLDGYPVAEGNGVVIGTQS